MSDRQNPAIEPVSPLGDAAPVQPVRSEGPSPATSQRSAVPRHEDVSALTSGGLSAAYAQFVVNPDTHDVVIRIREVATDRVINEYPSREVEAMATYMKQYADVLARRRAAQRNRSAD
jgi:hypothetical protein